MTKLALKECVLSLEKLPLTADEVINLSGKRIKLSEDEQILLEVQPKFFQLNQLDPILVKRLSKREKIELNYQNELILAVFGNPVILSNIFSHIDYPTFKGCRTVCATWADVVKADLRLRSKVKFDLYPQTSNSNPERIYAQLSALQQLGIVHVSFQDQSPSTPIPPAHQQFLENLFQNLGPTFISLDFSLSLDSQDGAWLLKTIHKTCTNLKEFCFTGPLWVYPNLAPSFEPLTSVKYLKFYKNQRNFAHILPIFPSTESITFASASPALTFLNSNCPSTFNKLKVLKIANPPEFGQSFTHEWLYKHLYDMPPFPSLSSLELHQLEFAPLNEWVLSAICHRFSRSLKSLSLSLLLNALPLDSQLNFPKMGVLQLLRLKMETSTSPQLFVKIVPGFNTQTFPALENLILDLNTEAVGVEAFIASNFTKGKRHKNEIVSKVRFVFPNLEVKMGLMEAAERRLKSAFPNAEQDFGLAK